MPRHTRSSARRGNASPLATGDEVDKPRRRRRNATSPANTATTVSPPPSSHAEDSIDDEVQQQLQHEIALSQTPARDDATKDELALADEEFDETVIADYDVASPLQHSLELEQEADDLVDEMSEVIEVSQYERVDSHGHVLDQEINLEHSFGFADEGSSLDETPEIDNANNFSQATITDETIEDELNAVDSLQQTSPNKQIGDVSSKLNEDEVEIPGDAREILSSSVKSRHNEFQASLEDSTATFDHSAVEPRALPPNPQDLGEVEIVELDTVVEDAQTSLDTNSMAPDSPPAYSQAAPNSATEESATDHDLARTNLDLSIVMNGAEGAGIVPNSGPLPTKTPKKIVYWTPPTFEERLSVVGSTGSRKRKAEETIMSTPPTERPHKLRKPDDASPYERTVPSTEPRPSRQFPTYLQRGSLTPSPRMRRIMETKPSSHDINDSYEAPDPFGGSTTGATRLNQELSQPGGNGAEYGNTSSKRARAHISPPPRNSNTTVATMRTPERVPNNPVWSAAKGLFASISSPFRRTPNKPTTTPAGASPAGLVDTSRGSSGTPVSKDDSFVAADAATQKWVQDVFGGNQAQSSNVASLPARKTPSWTMNATVTQPSDSALHELHAIPEESSSLLNIFDSPQKPQVHTPLRASSAVSRQRRTSVRAGRKAAEKQALATAHADFEAEARTSRAASRSQQEENDIETESVEGPSSNLTTPSGPARSTRRRKRVLLDQPHQFASMPLPGEPGYTHCHEPLPGFESITRMARAMENGNMFTDVKRRNLAAEWASENIVEKPSPATDRRGKGTKEDKWAQLRKTGHIPGTPTVGASFGVPEDSDSDSEPESGTGDDSLSPEAATIENSRAASTANNPSPSATDASLEAAAEPATPTPKSRTSERKRLPDTQTKIRASADHAALMKAQGTPYKPNRASALRTVQNLSPSSSPGHIASDALAKSSLSLSQFDFLDMSGPRIVGVDDEWLRTWRQPGSAELAFELCQRAGVL